MIRIDISNLCKLKTDALTNKELFTKPSNIKKLLEKVKARKQGFYSVIEEKETLKKILSYAKTHSGKYKNITVLGIGGSALGTICLHRSLQHLFYNELPRQNNLPAFHVLDNIDPALISNFEDLIDLRTTLFIVVTKSGSTPETLAQYFHFAEKIHKHKLNPAQHCIFIIGTNTNKLQEIAQKNKIQIFEIPKNVGGRFSVLTAVGLLPAALTGIKVKELLKGAQDMKKSFFSLKNKSNLPYLIARIQYLLLKKGKTINVLMPYSQKLNSFSDWYRQLLAESIGKKGLGITPVNALGATDQHSQNQLYNEGPNDKLFMFIKVAKPQPDLTICDSNHEQDPAYFNGLTFGKLLETEMQGTIQALTANNRPNITIEITKVDEYNLGQLFMLFESATAFLGEMLGINAYNQPGVERSKQITKELLTNNNGKKHFTSIRRT